MNEYFLEWGYKPTKLIYRPILDNEEVGLYTCQPKDFKPDTAVTLKEMVSSVIEMETLI